MPRHKARKLVQALSPSQRERLIASLRTDEERLMVGLLLYAGLRASEALDLQWEDVRVDERKLLVRRGKGRKQRWVPIAKPLLPLLSTVGRKGPVLSTRTGNRLPDRTLRYRMKRLGDRANIPWLHAHILRHTAATEILRHSHDLEAVRRFLGHASLATTQIYTDLVIEDVLRAVDEVVWS